MCDVSGYYPAPVKLEQGEGTGMADCPSREKNKEDCPCTNKECDYNGICCECLANHRAKDGKPACMR